MMTDASHEVVAHLLITIVDSVQRGTLICYQLLNCGGEIGQAGSHGFLRRRCSAVLGPRCKISTAEQVVC